MRVSGNTAWIEKENWRDFREYEKELDVLIADRRMIVLCPYPLAASAAAQILDVARIHKVAAARRRGIVEIIETTELKQARTEIKRLNQDLEAGRAERTRERTINEALRSEIIERRQAEEKLRDSRKKLQALTARLESLREEERIRISREIHDELGQKLTGLKMDLQWVERRLGEMEPGLNKLLDRVVAATELVDGIIENVQEIAAELRPGVLDKLGLSAAMQYEVRRFQERTHISCEVRLPECEPTVSKECSTALFRIFQECLTNVARHARATKVEAELRLEDGWVAMCVRDNDRGITETEISNPRSLGLLGMKERAALLGGEMAVERAPGGGTTVTARIPQSGTPNQSKGPV